MLNSLPVADKRIIVPYVHCDYSEIGVRFQQMPYELKYSSRLLKTGKNYQNSLNEIQDNHRISSAGEEAVMHILYRTLYDVFNSVSRHEELTSKSRSEIREIYRNYAFTDLEECAIEFLFDCNSNAFDDLMGKNDRNWYPFQLTSSFLRTPLDEKNPEKPDYVDGCGKKYWLREYGDGNQILFKTLVPEGNGRIVPETDDLSGVMNLVTGIPYETVEPSNINRHTIGFGFNPSNRGDVVIGRRTIFRDNHRIFYIDANYSRSIELQNAGIRMVSEVGKEIN